MKRKNKKTLKLILILVFALLLIPFAKNIVSNFANNSEPDDVVEETPVVEETKVFKRKTFELRKDIFKKEVTIEENKKYFVSFDDSANIENIEVNLQNNLIQYLGLEIPSCEVKKVSAKMKYVNYNLELRFLEEEMAQGTWYGLLFFDVPGVNTHYMLGPMNGYLNKLNTGDEMFGKSEITVLYADSLTSPNKDLKLNDFEEYFVFTKQATFEITVEYEELKNQNKMNLNNYDVFYSTSDYNYDLNLEISEQIEGEEDYVFDPELYEYEEEIFNGNKENLEMVKSGSNYYLTPLELKFDSNYVYKISFTLEPKKTLIGQAYFVDSNGKEVFSSKSSYVDIESDGVTTRFYTYYFVLKEDFEAVKFKILSSNDLTVCDFSINAMKGGYKNE